MFGFFLFVWLVFIHCFCDPAPITSLKAELPVFNAHTRMRGLQPESLTAFLTGP